MRRSVRSGDRRRSPHCATASLSVELRRVPSEVPARLRVTMLRHVLNEMPHAVATEVVNEYVRRRLVASISVGPRRESTARPRGEAAARASRKTTARAGREATSGAGRESASRTCRQSAT
jgi:hypothetical protein